MNRIFVTGGSGLVGRNLVDQLRRASVDFIAPSSTDVDLLDIKTVSQAIEDYRPDLVIHCAGIVGGITANIAEPYSFCDGNAQMGLNLLRASRDLDVPNLINLGSSCMYPVEAKNPLQETAILTGALEPTNEGYALAKIISSRLCDYLSKQYGLNYKTIIPCNLYGPYDSFEPMRSHMIPSAMLKVHDAVRSDAKVVEIWGDGTVRREFMYVGDLVDFLLFAINRFDALPQSMNVGLGTDFSINEYYREIAEVIGYKGEFVHDVSRPTGMQQKLVDVSAQVSLGWTPKTSLRDGIQKTYEFLKEQLS